MITNRDIIVPALKAIGKEHVLEQMPNRNSLDRKPVFSAPHDVLEGLFIWDESKHGHKFWEDIRNEIFDFFNKPKVSQKNHDMFSRDENPEEPISLTRQPKPEPQHWTSRMAPMGITDPSFFGFLRK